jgi:hypothetical protein
MDRELTGAFEWRNGADNARILKRIKTKRFVVDWSDWNDWGASEYIVVALVVKGLGAYMLKNPSEPALTGFWLLQYTPGPGESVKDLLADGLGEVMLDLVKARYG